MNEVTLFEYQSEVSEMKLATYKTKAIAEAFFESFVEGTDAANIRAVQYRPEHFCYLYSALEDMIFELVKRVDKLENLKVKETA